MENKGKYYAVIFTSVQTDDLDGYAEMAEEMTDLASQQPGFMGIDSAKDGVGITISYWKTLEDISNWKNHARHKLAQRLGKDKWYKYYNTKIVEVLREYEFNRNQ